MLGSFETDVTALQASSRALVAVYVVVGSAFAAKVAISVASVIIRVGDILATGISATLNVARTIASSGVGVSIYAVIANVVAALYVTSSIAVVGVNVAGNLANVVTTDYVTNCIAIAIVNVRRNLASSATNVTGCITSVAVDVFLNNCFANKATKNTSGVTVIFKCVANLTNVSAALYITNGVTNIGVFVSDCTGESASIALCITSMIVNVGSVTGFFTVVTNGITFTFVNVGNLANASAQVTGLVTYVVVFVRSNAFKAARVTGCITRIVIGVLDSITRNATNITVGVTLAVVCPSVHILGDFTLQATVVTVGVALVGVNVSTYCALCLTYVTIGVASVVVLVSIGLAYCLTYVTLSITSVGVGMCDVTVVATTLVVTSGITAVGVFMICFALISTAGGVTQGVTVVIPNVVNDASLTAKVTSGVTNATLILVIVIVIGVVVCFGNGLAAVVITNVTDCITRVIVCVRTRTDVDFTTTYGCTLFGASIDELVGDLAGVCTLVTIGIASVGEAVRCYAFVSTEVTNSIAIVVVNVSNTVATGVSTNVANGIALITECLIGVRDVQRLTGVAAIYRLAFCGGTNNCVASGVASVIKGSLGVADVQGVASVATVYGLSGSVCSNNSVASSVAIVIKSSFGIGNVQRIASEITTVGVTSGIASIVELMSANFALESAAFYVTNGIASTGPFVACGASISAVSNVTNRVAGVIEFVRENLALESTANVVTGVIAFAGEFVICNFTGKGTTLGVTIGVTQRAKDVVGVGSPNCNQMHIICYGSCLGIPSGAVLELPTNKVVSALGGVSQIGELFTAGYGDRCNGASAIRIKGYGFGIKEEQNSRKYNRNREQNQKCDGKCLLFGSFLTGLHGLHGLLGLHRLHGLHIHFHFLLKNT